MLYQHSAGWGIISYWSIYLWIDAYRHWVCSYHLTVYLSRHSPVESGDCSLWPWLWLSLTLDDVITSPQPGHSDITVAMETLNALLSYEKLMLSLRVRNELVVVVVGLVVIVVVVVVFVVATCVSINRQNNISVTRRQHYWQWLKTLRNNLILFTPIHHQFLLNGACNCWLQYILRWLQWAKLFYQGTLVWY